MLELYAEYWAETDQIGNVDPGYIAAEGLLHIQPRRMKYLNSTYAIIFFFGHRLEQHANPPPLTFLFTFFILVINIRKQELTTTLPVEAFGDLTRKHLIIRNEAEKPSKKARM